MAQKIAELLQNWQELGPVAWAEGPYGWTGPDGNPVVLSEWQRAVLSTWWNYRETTTTLAISNIKKTGKTFINSLLLAWRWLSLPGLHFALGNDLDQGKSRRCAVETRSWRRM
jgi:hypothetical protein